MKNRIKYFRAIFGISQTKLAQEAGISRAHLARVESGQENVSVNTLDKIARVFGLSAKDLLEE